MNDSDQRLRFLSSFALDDLNSAAKTLDSLEEWLGRAQSIVESEGSVMEQEWHFNTAQPSLDPAAEADAANATLVHRFIGNLTPQQASDRRLWSYFSLVTFRDYTEQRWSLTDPKLKGSWKGRVEERWLQRSSSRVGLTRSAISRLWWAAALTVDPEMNHSLSAQNADPYAYTRVLMAKQDRFVGIAEREIGARGEHLFAHLEKLSQANEMQRELFARELAKELTLVGGYREVPYLTEEQVREEMDLAGSRVAAILSR